MTNAINDIQPECIFIHFLPVKISQEYLLPEMKNSLLISQMIAVFRSSSHLPCVWKVKNWKQTGLLCLNCGLWSKKKRYLDNRRRVVEMVLMAKRTGSFLIALRWDTLSWFNSGYGSSSIGWKMNLKLPTTVGYLCVLEQIPMSYTNMAPGTFTVLPETKISRQFS